MNLEVEGGRLSVLLVASVFSFLISFFIPNEMYSHSLNKQTVIFLGYEINNGKNNNNILIYCTKKNKDNFVYRVNRHEKDNTNLKFLKSIKRGSLITTLSEDIDLFQLVYKHQTLINLKEANTQKTNSRRFFRYMPILWWFFMILPLKNVSTDKEIELREITIFKYKYTLKLDFYYGTVIILTTILVSYLTGWRP